MINNDTNPIINWAFSDYANDANSQPFFSCKTASIKGRLINLVDIPSQAIRGTASIIGSVLASVILLCNAVRDRRLPLFYSAILTVTAGNLYVIATKTFVIVADILGIVVPELGRHARTLTRLFDNAFRMKFEDYNNSVIPKFQAADLKHTYVPQSFYVGAVSSMIIRELYAATSDERSKQYGKLSELINTTYQKYVNKMSFPDPVALWDDGNWAVIID